LVWVLIVIQYFRLL